MKQPCGEKVGPILCGRPKFGRSSRWCYWHWLLAQPPGVQDEHCLRRIGALTRNRMHEGDQICSVCAWHVPIFYFGPGTRCRGCESRAKHSSHVRRVYGANGPTYEKMYQLQDGRCAVCGHRQKIKRLALDHNHQTGEKRGLLCQWCNDQVIGSLGTTPETQLRAARALVEYLERPPASGEWSAAIRDAAIPHPRASAYTDESPPPF